MTAMIDLVFMLNIFFLVTSLVTALAEVDLPAAKHVVAADMESATTITILSAGGGADGQVYLGEDKESRLIPQLDEEVSISTAVTTGLAAGKELVVIKAERRVPLRVVSRVAAAASIDGVRLHLAVMELD
ncbi:MAG: biopolymer transporter ExbD [Pirellulales bacterium]|nr:biopolymer transporter ExbD [Pirellulales bacterium]